MPVDNVSQFLTHFYAKTSRMLEMVAKFGILTHFEQVQIISTYGLITWA